MNDPSDHVVGLTLPRPEDCAALDDCIDRTGEADLTDPRHARAAGWLAMWAHDPVEPVPADLADRAMQRIVEARQRLRFAEQIAALRRDVPARGFGFQWREFATAAAVILIGLSLLIPVLDRSRADARRIACANNLAVAGMGMQQYAADHAGVMPRVMAQPGDAWWRVGEATAPGQPTRSNAAHLYVLIRTRYVRPGQLDCPDNVHAPRRSDPRVAVQREDWRHAAAVSYSYQNQFTAEPIRLDGTPDLVVLADKNPLFVIRVHGLEFDDRSPPTTSSRFHNRVGPGQNVLAVAGNVTFTPSPVLTAAGPRANRTDNIWLLDTRPGQRTYTGSETPDAPDRDAFLVP